MHWSAITIRSRSSIYQKACESSKNDKKTFQCNETSQTLLCITQQLPQWYIKYCKIQSPVLLEHTGSLTSHSALIRCFQSSSPASPEASMAKDWRSPARDEKKSRCSKEVAVCRAGFRFRHLVPRLLTCGYVSGLSFWQTLQTFGVGTLLTVPMDISPWHF